ncbi:hypothetical protein FHG89_17070 [Micromonospora orduensis]|uniref:Uncharacterized protein n=1 Tax=Micromonospora orduensis TaxID=1420891 RepID=A0A5C4QL64_9ACTN|nr:phage tail protein [Micromonospora orduensis]TNH27815.1 hypothetical protein FHG89_17070 [Micromonospora orduensis]
MSPTTLDRSPTRVRAVPRLLGREVELSWTNPPVSAFGGGFLLGVRVVRRERTFPLDPDDGVVVHDESAPVVDRLVDAGLTPLTRYYYTVFSYDGTDFHAGDGARASALATDEHGLGERLYRLLPAVHQREDRPLRPDEVHALAPEVQEALRVLPPQLRGAGQLRRFLTAATAPLGLMRSTAEALRQLHDVDRVAPEYLPLLAAFLDWRTDRTLPVYSQRNEVRAAPHLYRGVGTVPNLRSIVTRYTGWQIQVAEYAQHITRAHHAPQQNVFALRETGTGWVAAGDAADLLGFAPPNTGAGSATVTGTTSGPFALRAGMELTVSTDGAGPVTARFARGDAVNLGAATTAEVAAALNRQFDHLTATALPGGRLRLDAHGGTLRVEAPESSLVTLDGAPRGRLSVVPAGSSAFRLFHAVADPLGPVDNRAARRAVAGDRGPRRRAGPRAVRAGRAGRPDPGQAVPGRAVGQLDAALPRWRAGRRRAAAGRARAAGADPAGLGRPARDAGRPDPVQRRRHRRPGPGRADRPGRHPVPDPARLVPAGPRRRRPGSGRPVRGHRLRRPGRPRHRRRGRRAQQPARRAADRVGGARRRAATDLGAHRRGRPARGGPGQLHGRRRARLRPGQLPGHR